MHHNFRSGSKGTSLKESNPLFALRSRPYDGKIAGLYDLEETLGRGHFAVVKLARHVFTGEKVAVKVIDKSKLDEVSKAHLFQEVRCMKLVQHPNVVRLYEVIDTATKLYLVLELGDGGDLYEYILKHDTGLPEKVAKEYFTQIVRAISYCHQLHVVHRDLKPENVVFFKKQGIVKLTDFGFSNKFYPGQKLETSCGSLAYSAPEILLGDSYDAPAVDVWSLGVILYMLVCGQPPFQEANDSETLTMIMDCKYDIPAHVSDNCQKLISRMLVRIPDKRATLLEIIKHPWLNDENIQKHENPDMLPLVSKEQLSEEDHNLIIQKIVNGNIASKEDILESLEKNEYNHITATYYLLAERKLRSKTQEHLNKNKRPDQLSVSPGPHVPEKGNSSIAKPSLLSVPRTPGDLPQRSRKCSIVQEDEEEEDISPCSRQENLGQPLNRRGSRSEGRLNFALQERIADSERRKPPEKIDKQKNNTCNTRLKGTNINTNINTKIKNIQSDMPKVPIITTSSEETVERDAVQIPLTSNVGTCSHVQLNEIFEDSELFNISQTPRKYLNRNQSHEQRKLKYHKSRTTSCSSSDASDDDSEKRKKQAQKLNSSSKPYQGRRDSHDDSSDSQEPGAAGGSSGNKKFNTNSVSFHSNKNNDTQKHKVKNSNNNNGKKNVSNTNLMFGRRQKVVKKRNGKTRLRESQSLNRITEVQEDGSQTVVLSPAALSDRDTLPPKVKSIGAKILQSFNKTIKKTSEDKYLRIDYKIMPISKNLAENSIDSNKMNKNLSVAQGNNYSVEKCSLKKNQILEKYFHCHKKICIPIPAFLTKNRLYKAQSCSSLTKNKILLNADSLSQISHDVIRNESDMNQNDNNKLKCSPNVIDLNNVCNELTEICAIRLGNASKCCSFC